MQIAVPQYAAVDPLTVLFCIREYKKDTILGLHGINEDWLAVAREPETLKAYLQKEYKKAIDIA